MPQLLELQQKIRGLEHPATLASMSELSRTLSLLNKFTEAEALQQKV